MSSLASQVGDLIPEGNLKNNLRFSAFKVMFTTIGTREVQIGTVKDKVSAAIGRLIFSKESLGEREIEGYLQHYDLKLGDTVINAGSYHGYMAIYVAKKVGPTGKVICFEPEPNNLRLLRKNIALNNLTNVEIIPRGLWSSNTSLPLISMGSGSKLEPNSAWEKQTIPVTTLDSAVSELGLSKVDFITMDIEGAEIEAVKGATKTIMDNPGINIAIASYHNVDGAPTSLRVEKILKQCGMSTFTDYPRHITTYGSRQHS
jgi:FkbM family methyltransferase